jgi:HD superfamily phosphohydrolase YqeK
MKLSKNEFLEMIEDCEARESRLTDWERNFLDSVSGRLAAGKPLSVKQIEVLTTIWEHATGRG